VRGPVRLHEGDQLVESRLGVSLDVPQAVIHGALRATLPAGGTYAGAPCWKPTSSGFKYTDPELTPDGLHVVQLEAGGDGRAKIVVRGGANLHMPGLGLALPVTVRLHRADGGPCWGPTFPFPSRNVPGRFKARSQ
jgi:hypothetical protein